MRTIKRLLRCMLLASVFLSFAPAGASGNIISNLSLLKVGCYLFTDKLEQTSANEVLSASPMPDAFLGNSAQKVECTQPHHLEISSINFSKAKSTLRLDSIPLKTGCIVGNIKLLNPGHTQHQVKMYFKVYREGKLNRSICGVTSPSFVHPKNSNYRIYEAFTDPHLRILG